MAKPQQLSLLDVIEGKKLPPRRVAVPAPVIRREPARIPWDRHRYADGMLSEAARTFDREVIVRAVCSCLRMVRHEDKTLEVAESWLEGFEDDDGLLNEYARLRRLASYPVPQDPEVAARSAAGAAAAYVEQGLIYSMLSLSAVVFSRPNVFTECEDIRTRVLEEMASVVKDVLDGEIPF